MHHLVVYVPVTHADRVRKALAEAGAGKIGAYDSCSFSVRGVGRFRPLPGARPHVGTEGVIEEVEEERIEVVVPDGADLKSLLRKLRAAHPYEEPAVHVVKVVDESEL